MRSISGFDSSQPRPPQDFCSFPCALTQVLRRRILILGCFSSLPSDQIEFYGKETLFLYLWNIPISVVTLIIIICRIVCINNVWLHVLFLNYPHQVFMIDYPKTWFIMCYSPKPRRKMYKEFRRMAENNSVPTGYIIELEVFFILNIMKL